MRALSDPCVVATNLDVDGIAAELDWGSEGFCSLRLPSASLPWTDLSDEQQNETSLKDKLPSVQVQLVISTSMCPPWRMGDVELSTHSSRSIISLLRQAAD